MDRAGLRRLRAVQIVRAAAIAALPAASAVGGLVVTAEAPAVQGSLVPGATTYDFNSLSLGSHTDSGLISGFGTYTATSPGFSIQAGNDWGGSNQSNYMAVGSQSNPTTSTTLTLTTPRNYIGIYWPAGDAQNYLDVYSGSTLLATYSLGRLVTLLPTVTSNNAGLGTYFGNPNTRANSGEPYAYVNFFGTNGTIFDKLVFRNNGTGTGFETDNHSIATGASVRGYYLESVPTAGEGNSVSGWVTPSLDLGAVHITGTFGTKTAYIDNTGSGTAYEQGLYATATGTGNVSVSGSVSGLMPADLPVGALTIGIPTTTTKGSVSATVAVDYRCGAKNGKDTTDITPDGTVSVTGMIYSGQSTWTGTGTTGTWGGDPQSAATHVNWSANDGAPGVWSGFANVDAATFNSSIGSGASAISVSSAVSVAGITFNNNLGGRYTIAAGTGGSLTLSSSSGTAGLSDMAGTHTITSPITLQSNLTANVTNSGDTLTVAQLLQGGTGTQVVNKTGAGTLVLSGSSTYTGATTISAGTLQIGNGGASGSLATASITDNGTLVINRSDSLTIGQVISGTGSLTQMGSGTTILTSTSNSYSGATLVSRGILQEGASNVLPNGSALTIGSTTTAGRLEMGSYTDTVSTLAFGTGGGSIGLTLGNVSTARLTTTGTVNMTNGTVAFNDTPDGTVGKYVLIKAGTTLSGTASGVAPAGYRLATITGTAGEVDLIHKATIGTITATPAAPSIITGGSTAFTFTVANSAPTNSDSLQFSAAAGSGATGSVAGPVTVVPGGTSGAQSGMTFTKTTVGAGQTGSYTVSDPNATNTSQTGTVTVNVYDHASVGTFPGGAVSVGNVRTGYSTFTGSSSLAVTNGNTGDYRVGLKGSGVSANGISLSSISAVAPGASANITPTVAAGRSAGAISQPLTYTFADDSSLSGASANVAQKTITVTGGVYDLANPTGLPSSVSFGNRRPTAGWTDAAPVLVGNKAITNATYQDSLDASASADNSRLSATGFTGLAAGINGANPGNVKIAADTSTAGSLAGTVTVALNSNHNNVAGLSDAGLGSKTISVTGDVYAYAALGSTPLAITKDFGNLRPGTAAGGLVSFTNTTSSAVVPHTDDLRVSGSNASGNLSGGPAQTLTASSSGNTGSYSYSLDTSTAGAKSGSLDVNYTSIPLNGTGLDTKSLAVQTIDASAKVYRYATGTLDTTTVSLGNLHAVSGGSVTAGLRITDTAAADGYSDSLGLGLSGTPAGIVYTAGSSVAAGTGSQQAGSLQIDTSTARRISSTLDASLISSPTVNLDSKSVGSGIVTVTGIIYSGQSTWNSSTGGSWGGDPQGSAHDNWDPTGGAPGVWAGFDNVDTATFGDKIGSSTATVSVDAITGAPGQPISVKGITFDNATGQYEIAHGTGSLALKSDSGTASLNDLNGNHSITAAVTLQSNVSVNVASSSDKLTVAQLMGGGSGNQSVTTSGAGTLVSAGASTYTGGTNINGGVLQVASAENAGVSGPLGKSGTISFGGGTLQYSSVNQYDYSGRFSNTPNQAYSIDTNGQKVTFASNLTSSGGSLTKLGAGTLALTGSSSTYTGLTTVETGTLQVDGSIASSHVQVKTGATLTGTNGTTGDVTVENGATISPGGSGTASKLTTAAQVWNSGGTYAVDVLSMPDAGNYDLLSMSGITAQRGFKIKVNFPTLTLNDLGTGAVGTNMWEWLIAESSGSGSNFGTSTHSLMLSMLNLQPTVDPYKYKFSLSEHDTGTGHHGLYLQYSYNAVPEAGTAMLGVMAVMPILAHRRRRAAEKVAQA